VNISYYGAVSYHLDPAYGATKAGLDKLTFDMAQDSSLTGLRLFRSGPARQPQREPRLSSQSCRVVTISWKTPKHQILRACHCFALCRSKIDVEVGKCRDRS